MITCGDCIHYCICSIVNYNDCSYDEPVDECKYFQSKDVRDVVHSQWFVRLEDPDTIKCENCGLLVQDSINLLSQKLYSFCPRCGAVMDEGKCDHYE